MWGILKSCKHLTAWLKESLYELFGATYTNKMHLLIGNPFHKNSIVKHAELGAILGWVTSWEVSRKACEWGQNTLKRLVLVCGISRQSWKQSRMLQVVSEHTSLNTMWFRDEPNGSCLTSNVWGWWRRWVVAIVQDMIMCSSWQLLGKPESYRNERDP
jgi:hypothetical protein